MAIKKNDEFEITIKRFGANGEGVGEVDGKVVFVPFALPDEKVLVHVIKDEKSFVIAKLKEIIVPSKDRVCAPCKFFGKCGGCDLQHLSYQKQLEAKQEMVRGAISKYAGTDTKVEMTIPSEKEFRYRNKFAFPVQEVDSEIKIGMYQKNSHRLIEIDDCLLQSETAKKIVKIFKEFMHENNLTAYNEQTKKGLIKHLVARENNGKFILTVVVTENKNINFEPLIQKLKNEFEEFGIVKNVNKLNNNVIFGNLDIKIYGNENLDFDEMGVHYSVNNRSFLQVNSDIKNKIYSRVLDELSGEKFIIDAYAGAGLLSSILTKTGAEVVGVEIVKEATENAEKLKKINNLHNLTNKNGDCTVVIPELAKQIKGDFSVVVDPPRKGLTEEVIDAFLKSKPKKIVYISCNPATLARDLKFFLNDYDISFVQPYDMFPQTANVETLVCLNKKETNLTESLWYGWKTKNAKYWKIFKKI